jgi:hypothetical protein
MDGLFRLSAQCDINPYIPYLGEDFEYSVVAEFDQIKDASNDCVMIYGAKICDVNEMIDFDKYKKKKLWLKKCSFEKILGIRSLKTEMIFEDCEIKNCAPVKKSKRGNESAQFFYCHDVVLLHTQFSNCELSKVGKGSNFLLLVDARVEKCKFDNCRIRAHADGRVDATLIFARNISIENCTIKNCSVFGEGEYGLLDCAHMRLIEMKGGSIGGCKFEECKAESNEKEMGKKDNYILLYDENCIQGKKNMFNNCVSYHVWNYGHRSSNNHYVQKNNDGDEL